MDNYLFLLATAAIVIPIVIFAWHRYRRHTLLRQWEARQPYAWVEYKRRRYA